ncbi:hypothetical protein KAR91_47215 [Candidatus Pacearchaeota archaeon]|nr:hypothetical protein [Candidatus Pacearchaeota archaeon]
MANNLNTDQALVEADPVTKELKATAYFEDFLYDIVADIGGEGGSSIADLFASEVDKLPYFFSLIKTILQDKEVVKEISADYTVRNNEALICTAAVDITLTPLSFGKKVYVKRTSGIVNILGTIDGGTNLTLGTAYSSVTLIYTTQWWII